VVMAVVEVLVPSCGGLWLQVNLASALRILPEPTTPYRIADGLYSS